jgi:hypothetical protein
MPSLGTKREEIHVPITRIVLCALSVSYIFSLCVATAASYWPLARKRQR